MALHACNFMIIHAIVLPGGCCSNPNVNAELHEKVTPVINHEVNVGTKLEVTPENYQEKCVENPTSHINEAAKALASTTSLKSDTVWTPSPKG